VSGLRVVLDTNVVVSALLFERGSLAWIRAAWQTGLIQPVVAEPTVRDLMRVLAYPKVRLNALDLEQLLADLLPWCETWTAPIISAEQQVRDAKNQIFVDLALSAFVSALVSDDADLLVLRDQLNPMQVLTSLHSTRLCTHKRLSAKRLSAAQLSKRSRLS
jgi:putative PIN family toxin of toxin-antitoxin system